jgi:hypothetical protein
MSHQDHRACIDTCDTCAEACDHCAIACLNEADPAPMVRCIALDIDCAQACRLAAGYMARGSALDAAACNFCAAVCRACGEECKTHPMEHCQNCAAACARCAEECERMAGSPQPAQTAAGSHGAH